MGREKKEEKDWRECIQLLRGIEGPAHTQTPWFHGVWDSAGPAHPDCYQSAQLHRQMDHEHGTVCQLNSEHQIRPCAPSSVISRPTCFSSSLRCCWQVGSAPFVRRRCDCLANSAPTINI